MGTKVTSACKSLDTALIQGMLTCCVQCKANQTVTMLYLMIIGRKVAKVHNHLHSGNEQHAGILDTIIQQLLPLTTHTKHL